ncbi:MAG: undecaprenyl-diphosphate phosphatase [Wenzhouxiangellaceae bacterium]
MTLWQQLVLALVQGLTEFLPISSSAHLILASELLAWQDQGLVFDTAVHLGTLSAIIWYFRAELRLMLSGLKEPGPGRQLIVLSVVGSLPVLIVGFLAASFVSGHLRGAHVVAVTTIFFGLVLWQADRSGQRQRTVDDLTWRDALNIGLWQILALIPGTSRSGITLTAGLYLGLERAAAARFSFLLAIPVLAGAGLYSILSLASQPPPGASPLLFVGAATVSAVVALLTVHWFVRFVDRVGVLPFVIYRLLLGMALLFWIAI